jgi:hypothetical protein
MMIKCFLVYPNQDLLILVSQQIFPVIERFIKAQLCLPQISSVMERLSAALDVFREMSDAAITFLRSLTCIIRDLIQQVVNGEPGEQEKLSVRLFESLSHMLAARSVNFGMLTLYQDTDISVLINSLCHVVHLNPSIRSNPKLVNPFFRFFQQLFHVRSFLHEVDDHVYLQFIEQAKFSLSTADNWGQIAPAMSEFVRDQDIIERVKNLDENLVLGLCMAVIRWRFVMDGRGSEELIFEVLRIEAQWLVIQLNRLGEDAVEYEEFLGILMDRSLVVSSRYLASALAAVANALRAVLAVYDGISDE